MMLPNDSIEATGTPVATLHRALAQKGYWVLEEKQVVEREGLTMITTYSNGQTILLLSAYLGAHGEQGCDLYVPLVRSHCLEDLLAAIPVRPDSAADVSA